MLSTNQVSFRGSRRHVLFCIVAVVFFSGCGAATSTDQAVFPESLAVELQGIVDERLNYVRTPGMTLTVVLEDGAERGFAAGLASKELKVDMKPDDIFRVGSITKTFNAAVCMQLVDEGVIDLDDPIDKWVPDFNLGSEVTVRRLLSHTSGVFNYTDDPYFIAQPTATPKEVITWALQHEQVFEPGTDWSYSNTGFYLTGLLIEAATGEAFGQQVRDRLLDPLGLNHTFLDDFDEFEGLVNGYAVGVSDQLLAPDYDMSWAWAAGAMVSNGHDLCRWGRALMGPYGKDQVVLNDDSRSAMITESELVDGRTVGYGLGIDIRHRSGLRLVGHTGSTIGFKGEMFVDAKTGTCAALLTNDFLADMSEVTLPIWERLATHVGVATAGLNSAP